MFLQINQDGRVSGSDARNAYSKYLKFEPEPIRMGDVRPGKPTELLRVPGVLQMKSVKPGHVVIRGQSSSLFLCADSGGHLRGQVQKNI